MSLVPKGEVCSGVRDIMVVGMAQDSNPINVAKRKAAIAAVDEWVRDGMVVGVGSGSTVVYAVDRLAERVKTEGIRSLIPLLVLLYRCLMLFIGRN